MNLIQKFGCKKLEKIEKTSKKLKKVYDPNETQKMLTSSPGIEPGSPE
jgi:hypothetical protein